MILSPRQLEVVRWYWHERRTIREIADWLEVSPASVEREIAILRAVFRSHGKELPKYDAVSRKGSRAMPVLSSLPAA